LGESDVYLFEQKEKLKVENLFLIVIIFAPLDVPLMLDEIIAQLMM